MNIKINHVAKMEGHTGFMASVLKGDVKSAKFEVQEGIRLIEGLLIGRHYADVPIIAQRICGICPVVHNLTAIKAIEKAFRIKVSDETTALRSLMELGQIIHSHSLHLFFLSLADFLDIENDLKMIERYPEETKMAVELREFGMALVRVIGGRVVHPLTNETGGFKKVPTNVEVCDLLAQCEKMLPVALRLGEFFKTVKLPDFERPTEYLCLERKGEYAIYDGSLVSNKGLHIPVERFENDFKELHRPREIIKRVTSERNTSYMIGAIARVNIQHNKLGVEAHRFYEGLGYKFPDYNPFHNIMYQMVEVIHCIEESKELLLSLVHSDLNNALTKDYQVIEGVGVSAVEAPRGTLFYHLDIDDRGYVKNANIITPTAQYLSHMEDDIIEYMPRIMKLGKKAKERKIRAIIRSYDPCISCAVH